MTWTGHVLTGAGALHGGAGLFGLMLSAIGLGSIVGAFALSYIPVYYPRHHLIPLATGVAMHAQIPNSVLEIYDGCGHLAPGQCASRIGPRMVDFLQGKQPQTQQTAEIGMNQAN